MLEKGSSAPASAAARNDFLRRLFHDLATPLSAVSLHLEAADRRARRGSDPTESLAIARAELARAFELFDRGREFLLETSNTPPQVLAFDELVARAASLDGTGRVSIQGETGGKVLGDGTTLSAAVTALVANAVEFSDMSSARVFRERAGGRLRVRVENPGRLPSEDPEALFSPRAAAPGKNWGMGLAGARLHAADAGGTVTLSQHDEHVVATLELPEETA